MELYLLFISVLFITFFIVRVFTQFLHDHEGYVAGNERSKTPTGVLRKKTGLDIHHFHFGIVILLLVLPMMLKYGIDTYSIVLLGVGLSLVIDQIELVFRDLHGEYFYFRSLIFAFLLHIITALIALAIRIYL